MKFKLLIATGLIGLSTAHPLRADDNPAPMCIASIDVAYSYLNAYGPETSEKDGILSNMLSVDKKWRNIARYSSTVADLFQAKLAAWGRVDHALNYALWCVDNAPREEGS
jgi:hypothetical protein